MHFHTLPFVRRSVNTISSTLFLLVLIGALSACSEDDDSSTSSTTPPASGLTWPDRADSTRVLANGPLVNYRLYLNDVELALDSTELRVALDWANTGPDVVNGTHALVMQLVGPTSRTLRIGDLEFTGLAPGQSTTTTLMRRFPPDITAGSYSISLQVKRESAPAGPLDFALQERFFGPDRFFQVSSLTVPE